MAKPINHIDGLFNHLVLPPQLPPRKDENIVDIEGILVERLLQVSRWMRDLPERGSTKQVWETIRLCLLGARAANPAGRVERIQLTRTLLDMKDGDFMILYIACQNAGLFIYYPADPKLKGNVVVEAFEASSHNKDVQATTNALQWDFPGIAVAVPVHTFKDSEFLQSFTTFLEHASVESPKDFGAQAFKAGTTVYEYRDSPNPSLITSLLMGILEENGRRIAPTRLQKRVRDDVCWNNGREPWRRTPYWLVLRVGLQRYLSLRLGHEIGHAEYKFALCLLLTTLVTPLEKYVTSLDRLDLLRKKICRRLVKLDTDKTRAASAVSEHYDFLHHALDKRLGQSLQVAADYIDKVWGDFKRQTAKKIPLLPKRATRDDVCMRLRQSRPILEHMLHWGQNFIPPDASSYHERRRKPQSADHAADRFAVAVFEVEREEGTLRHFCSSPVNLAGSEAICSIAAEHIQVYVAKAEPLYQDNPEQKSIMLLTVMELWVKMDSAACTLYPLLEQFHPVFHPNMLDLLLLPKLSDMNRLHKVQVYLGHRASQAKGQMTIFHDPVPGCFAEKFYEEHDDDASMATAYYQILADANQRRTEKRDEWERKSEEYEQLSRQIDAGTCIYQTLESAFPSAMTIHDPQCPRCRLIRRAKAKRIQIFEEPLPSNTTMAKAVIFELLCPEALADYRDTTWFIMNSLGGAIGNDGKDPKIRLREYAPIRCWGRQGEMSLSLSSVTKSFSDTHYAWLNFPVNWEASRGVCRPNALRLSYYDNTSKVWTGKVGSRIGFAHHLKLALPSSSPFATVVGQCNYIWAGAGSGQSSYQVLASQSNCPPGLNMHEYIAFQTICNGKYQRWTALLVELASSNLNFSNEATTIMVSYLSSQCGPRQDGDRFRAIHSIFHDQRFTQGLSEQLSARLDILAGNWREVHLMQLCITLGLRLFYLSDRETGRTEACRIVKRAREICLSWVRMLRKETFQAEDEPSATRYQSYALWAALLCRRTFEPFAHDKEGLMGRDLSPYVECSITMNENLSTKMEGLAIPLRQAIMRDMKMAQEMSQMVQDAIRFDAGVFLRALCEAWPEPGDRRMGPLTMEADGWLHCLALATHEYAEQRLDFNYLRGMLLVDGQAIGKLPRDSNLIGFLRGLFGDLPLLTMPTTYMGMKHVLCIRPHGFRIFVGYDSLGIALVAQRGAKLSGLKLRLVPPEVFRDDLPGSLVEHSVHWLDLHKDVVYIVPKNRRWVPLDRDNWILRVRGGPSVCAKYLHKVPLQTLIDPASPLFARIGGILECLENPRWMVVSQPRKANLEVRLPRHEQEFFVGKENLLESSQMKSEIDPNQDAGAWYGFQNKLVLRSKQDHNKRSILVPMGKIQGKRRGCHVESGVAIEQGFLKFTINDTLGRIDCAPETLLLYTKALIHALTSSVVPDSLTGRTGTEEAIVWMQSAMCQPWLPIRHRHMSILSRIASLSPRKDFYPPDMQEMRMDHWDEHLTTTIQHEALCDVVASLVDESKKIGTFHAAEPVQGEPEQFPRPSHGQLQRRALVRRSLYSRPLSDDHEPGTADEVRIYQPRDRPLQDIKRHSNVLEIVRVIRDWPERMRTTRHLARELSLDMDICGFHGIFDTVSLSEKLNVDFAVNWGPLVNYFRQPLSKFAIMFSLAPMVFKKDAPMTLAHTLVAFAVFHDLRAMELPPWIQYEKFGPNAIPSEKSLKDDIKQFARSRPVDESDELGGLASSNQVKKLWKLDMVWREGVKDATNILTRVLLRQWPCEVPYAGPMEDNVFLNVQGAMEVICPEWRRLFENRAFHLHLEAVQAILNERWTENISDPRPYTETEAQLSARTRGQEMPSLNDLMRKTFVSPESNDHIVAPSTTAPPSKQLPPNGPRAKSGVAYRLPDLPSEEVPMSLGELDQIVQTLQGSRSRVRQAYGKDLALSIDAFRGRLADRARRTTVVAPSQENVRLDAAQKYFRLIAGSLCKSTSACSARRISLLVRGGLWPIVTRISVLGYMRSKASWAIPDDSMKKAIIDLGLLITAYQRNKRLREYASTKDTVKYNEEESNGGHGNWQPTNHPSWLLLEIESNMLIRPDQVDVALATIRPQSGANSVLQMNMGQGKTSVIIPMVASVLADGKNIARIVVPKSLLRQTAQILQIRLGNLLNRRIAHIPFARRTSTDEGTIKAYHNLHKSLLRDGGVMISLPEHNLSFMLSGLQRLLDGHTAQAGPMIKMHRWLGVVCRDVLDESDFTLAVRTQLIYPSGSQMAVDGHPHRWKVAQVLLDLVDLNLHGLARDFPHSIEVVRRHDEGFPFIFFLRNDVEEELMRRLTADILKKNSPILPMEALSPAEKRAVRDFVSNVKVSKTSIDKVRELLPDQPSVRQVVYLMRGLLVNRILLMTLKKRWNVQYGLHPGRDPIAVPFHAKGVPSEQSEWGHPDVAILFTCLSFYYGGVTTKQLKQALEQVLKSDDPASEYDKWILSSESFPDSLRSWNSINVDDEFQLTQMWQGLRFNINLVDYFLNTFVFPMHAKQFKVKLQSNGWDLPLLPSLYADLNPKVSQSKALSTGFSGTNDNRNMLPLNITQEDLPSLSHTNAEVMTYLLDGRSRECVHMVNASGKRADELEMLELLKVNHIRVLIDAGAQVLEMDNRTLAETWLGIAGAQGALYFDEDRPMVINRAGSSTPFLASPFADDLSQCLVYLDEAHTRGTDLKLPKFAKGALTLGLGQTKDHTVQAAMRLRQLATTQRVTFFIPPEVHSCIADLRKKTITEKIDSLDVLWWLVNNTTDLSEQLQPLYYSQGVDFCKRMQAFIDYPNFLEHPYHREAFISAVKQDEMQTLKKLYEPRQSTTTSTLRGTHEKLRGYVDELKARRKNFHDTGRAVQASALQEVEQEREVAFEVETVRQVKKPWEYSPLSFPGLHRDLETFVRTGRLPAASSGVSHFIVSIGKTALGRKFGVLRAVESQSRLFVSAQFDRTVKLNSDLSGDNFLRPVNWILWSQSQDTAVVIIPEEAEIVMCLCRNSRGTPMPTHLLTYSAPVTRKMSCFNNLNFYSVPALPDGWKAPLWLRVELGIFSGRLYFDWDEFSYICRVLGVDETSTSFEEEEMDDEEIPNGDGPVEAAHEMLPSSSSGDGATLKDKKEKKQKSFTTRPLTFLQEWIAMRRRGQDFVHTPMGFITQGKQLHADHAFFKHRSLGDPQQQQQQHHLPLRSRRSDRDSDDDEDLYGTDGGDYEDDVLPGNGDSGGDSGSDEEEDGYYDKDSQSPSLTDSDEQEATSSDADADEDNYYMS